MMSNTLQTDPQRIPAKKRKRKILLLALCFLLPTLVFAGCCIWYFKFPQFIYGVCRTPVINRLFDGETLVAAYRSAPLASRNRFAETCHQYQHGADDEMAIRLMLFGYRENEPIPEELLLYALDPKFRTTASLALKLIAENKAIVLSDAAVDRLFEMAEAGGYLHDETILMPVVLFELSWRDKERSRRAVETVNDMFRDEMEAARRRKRAAENPEGADSQDPGDDAVSKPFEPWFGFSEEPDPRGSYICFAKTAGHIAAGDFYPPEPQSDEKK